MPKSKFLQSTGKLTDSALNHCIKLNSKATHSATQHIPAIEHIQNMNFHMAYLDFSDRRLERSLDSFRALMDEGKQQSMLLWLWYFFIDVLLFICEVVYGVVQPMVYLLWVTLMRALLIITFNFIFFGGIYLLMVY